MPWHPKRPWNLCHGEPKWGSCWWFGQSKQAKQWKPQTKSTRWWRKRETKGWTNPGPAIGHVPIVPLGIDPPIRLILHTVCGARKERPRTEWRPVPATSSMHRRFGKHTRKRDSPTENNVVSWCECVKEWAACVEKFTISSLTSVSTMVILLHDPVLVFSTVLPLGHGLDHDRDGATSNVLGGDGWGEHVLCFAFARCHGSSGVPRASAIICVLHGHRRPNPGSHCVTFLFLNVSGDLQFCRLPDSDVVV